MSILENSRSRLFNLEKGKTEMLTKLNAEKTALNKRFTDTEKMFNDLILKQQEIITGITGEVFDNSGSVSILEEVLVLRTQYRQACNQLCQLSGQPLKDKLLIDEVTYMMSIIPNEYQIKATQLVVFIQALILELRRKDGDNAWDRI